jgi:signal transduction histidine kinase
MKDTTHESKCLKLFLLDLVSNESDNWTLNNDRKDVFMERKPTRETDTGNLCRAYTGIIAHQMNNLVSIMSGVPEVLIMRMSPEPPVRDMLSRIVSAAAQMAVLNRQSLMLANRDNVMLSEVHLNEIIENAQAIMNLPGHLQLQVHLEPDLPAVAGDEIQLLYMVINLLEYAFSQSQSPRIVMLKTIYVHPDLSGAEDVQEKDHAVILELVFGDPGTKPADLDVLSRAFDPADPPNKGNIYGLSLSISALIVQDHNGTIVQESHPETGVSLRCIFPSFRQE